MPKLYCYVDETGQDTEGRLFIVSIIVTERDKDELLKRLDEVERNSTKGKLKWSRANRERRVAYIKLVCREFKGQRAIRYSIYRMSKEYDLATIMAISKAVHFHPPAPGRKILVYIDALGKSKRRFYASELRKLGVSTDKVQGVVKEISNSAIRLADAIAGWVREVREGDPGELNQLFEKALSDKTVVET